MAAAALTTKVREDGRVVNAVVLATGADTGFWDQLGQPAPWPDDIAEWRPTTSGPLALNLGEQLFSPRQLERSPDTPRPGT